MSGSSDQIIHALAQHSQTDSPRHTINLLFAHCDDLQTDQILSHLRAARYAPRGLNVSQLDDLQNALSTRSWDLLVIAWKPDYQQGLTPESAVERLHHLDRDLPVLLLLPGAELPDPTHWLGSGIRAVIPAANTELLLLLLGREFEALNTRRELLKAQMHLHQLTEHNQHLVQHSSLAICFVHNGLILYANDSFAHLFGYEQGTRLQDHSLRQLIQPQHHDDLDLMLHESLRNGTTIQRTLGAQRPDTTRFDSLFSMHPTEYRHQHCLSIEVVPDADCAEQVFRDINPISGLSNEHAFMHALETACQNAHRGGQDRSLLLLSLDHLDVIRSEVGADGVELILRTLATTLKEQISQAHLLGHLDNNCFAVLMHNANPDTAVETGDRLCHAISRHTCQVRSTSIHTTVSIGVVMINDSTPSNQEVLQRALMTANSLHSGNRPGNGVSLYQAEKTLLASIDTKMSRRLLNALKLNRFRLLFQPVVPLRLDTQTQYYEVLLRLISDSERALSPNAFIAQTIEPDVLIELDRWVIETALERLSEVFAAGRRVHLLLNLSGASLRNTDLLQWLADTLRQSQIPAEYLIFQISESDAAVNLMQARTFTHTLQQMNCKVCLKHFGSSPNSGHVRHELDTEFIKLDGSYIQDLENRNISVDTLQDMLQPLHQQHKLIIAPLVEKSRVIGDLYTAGIHLIQGYYLQQPREKMDYDFFNDGQ